MKPMMMEITQTIGEMLPTVAAMAPTVNNTSAGVPAANQKACFQSMSRRRFPTPLDRRFSPLLGCGSVTMTISLSPMLFSVGTSIQLAA
jgi:hypothetical protein